MPDTNEEIANAEAGFCQRDPPFASIAGLGKACLHFGHVVDFLRSDLAIAANYRTGETWE
jgi:hypothetical protein